MDSLMDALITGSAFEKEKKQEQTATKDGRY